MQIKQVQLDTVYDVPGERSYHHKMTDLEVAFVDGWNAYHRRMLGLEPDLESSHEPTKGR